MVPISPANTGVKNKVGRGELKTSSLKQTGRKKYMRKIILLFIMIVLPFVTSVDFALGAGKTIAVLPFYDDSGYRGPWELYTEVPTMLGDMLMDKYFYVVPMDSVMQAMPKPKKRSAIYKFIDIFRNKRTKQKLLSDLEILSIARKLNVDYAIMGIIDEFSYRRTGGGDVIIGGYKSYTAKVELNQVRVLRVADGTPMGSVSGDSDKNEKGLGLELLGKPRKRDLEFYSLDSLDFGSKGFLATLMGEATVDALNKVQKEIRAIITLPDTSWYAEKKFKVISVDGGIVNIDAGASDGIRPGDRFNVYTSESSVLVGRINVIQIWSDHVSKAEILEGRDEIRTDDFIMPAR